jgi:hypothetical protein
LPKLPASVANPGSLAELYFVPVRAVPRSSAHEDKKLSGSPPKTLFDRSFRRMTLDAYG